MFKLSNMLVVLIVGITFFGVSVQSCQRQDLEKYLQKAGEDIKSAKRYGKSIATSSGLRWFGYEPVTEYAFDSIPHKFFENPELIPFDQLEEAKAVEYKQEATMLFKQKIGDNTEINNSKFAKFFHRFAVNKMSLTKAEKKILKKNPIKLEESVRESKEDGSEAVIKVDMDEYRLYVLLNYVIKCDLEKEFEELRKRKS